MSLDSVAPDARIVLLAVPHPLSRRLGAYFQTVLAAGERSIACVLATSPDRPVEPGETVVYLRSAVADAVDLAVMADMAAGPDVLAAHAKVADLDDDWRHLATLAMERVVAKPEEAIRGLLRHAGRPLDERILAAAEACLPSLREDVAIYDHPLAFLAAVDRDAGAGERSAAQPPRTMLVLTGQPAGPRAYPFPDAEDRVVTEMALEDALSERLAAVTGPLGLIHLHHVQGSPSLTAVLDHLLPLLAPRGRLSGEESAAAAAMTVVAHLTLRCNHRGLVFRLSGREWQAAYQSWWR